jgi:hypothetical protein
VLLSGIILPLGPRHVQADGGAVSTVTAQTATRGLVEQRIYDRKTQIAADLSQGITPPQNLTQELDGLTGVPRDYSQRNLTNPPPAGSPTAPTVSVTPDSGGSGGNCSTWCYAPVDGGVSNYVAVNGNNDNLAEIEYFDSASDSAAYGVHVLGFHYALKSQFGSAITDTMW